MPISRTSQPLGGRSSKWWSGSIYNRDMRYGCRQNMTGSFFAFWMRENNISPHFLSKIGLILFVLTRMLFWNEGLINLLHAAARTNVSLDKLDTWNLAMNETLPQIKQVPLKVEGNLIKLFIHNFFPSKNRISIDWSYFDHILTAQYDTLRREKDRETWSGGNCK